jgi:hypothetical protein
MSVLNQEGMFGKSARSSGDRKKEDKNGEDSRNKRTIVLEQVENGVRITVVGPPYVVETGPGSTRDLATHNIGNVWVSDFAPTNDEDRAAYSAKHCTDSRQPPHPLRRMRWTVP